MHYRYIKEPSIEDYFLLIIITKIKLVIRGVLNNGLSPELSAGVYVLLALCGVCTSGIVFPLSPRMEAFWVHPLNKY